MLSAASIHKLVVEHCHKNNLKAPSYRSGCRIIYNVPDDLAILGREGSKAYRQQYDLLHIRAAEQSNELWQADHVLIDIEVLNDKNKPQNLGLRLLLMIAAKQSAVMNYPSFRHLLKKHHYVSGMQFGENPILIGGYWVCRRHSIQIMVPILLQNILNRFVLT